jgi:hypothetical protein
MKTVNGIMIACLLTAGASVFAQGPRRDGKWEVKTEMDMPGMPMKMPAMTATQCVTKEDADNPLKAAPRGRGNDQDECTVSDYKVDGGHVTWAMTCKGKEPMTGTGDLLYTADSYTGTMKMDRAGQVMTMKYSGKRLGDCVK